MTADAVVPVIIAAADSPHHMGQLHNGEKFCFSDDSRMTSTHFCSLLVAGVAATLETIADDGVRQGEGGGGGGGAGGGSAAADLTTAACPLPVTNFVR